MYRNKLDFFLIFNDCKVTPALVEVNFASWASPMWENVITVHGSLVNKSHKCVDKHWRIYLMEIDYLHLWNSNGAVSMGTVWQWKLIDKSNDDEINIDLRTSGFDNDVERSALYDGSNTHTHTHRTHSADNSELSCPVQSLGKNNAQGSQSCRLNSETNSVWNLHVKVRSPHQI